jgi:polyhydroxyalkanoate synthesis regulator protein
MASPSSSGSAEKSAPTNEANRSDDLAALKQQIVEMQKKLDQMGGN